MIGTVALGSIIKYKSMHNWLTVLQLQIKHTPFLDNGNSVRVQSTAPLVCLSLLCQAEGHNIMPVFMHPHPTPYPTRLTLTQKISSDLGEL
jgi:hypothetical protein